MHKNSVRHWVQGEQLLKQLLIVGVPIEVLDAIVKDRDFADLVADAINKLHTEHEQQDGVEERRALLETPLDDCRELRTVARNILNRRLGIWTLGDLALATEDEIQWERGMGGVSMMSVHKTLAVRGLTLRGESESKLERAVRLYGGIEYIPFALRQPALN